LAVKYRRIADELRREITSGTIQPGAPLPSEAELTLRYGVSRNTARLATGLLANEGLIEKRGTRMVVREHMTLIYHASAADLVRQRGQSVTDEYFTDVAAQGFTPSQRFELRIVALDAEIAERLDVDEGTAAALRRCIRYVNGQPNSIQDSYHPKWLTDAVPELMSPHDIEIGTNRLLAERGYELVAFQDDWRARPPTPEEAQALAMPRGTAVAICTATEFTRDRPIRVTVTTFVGDTSLIRYYRGEIEVIERYREVA
jgi:GntR family transcriptional regulator